MRELFIYYRSPVDRAAEVVDRVRAFQARLRARHPHLVARLLRRPEEHDGRHTWMEIYALPTMHGAEGISPDLQRDIDAEAAVLADCLDGARHTEVFNACAW